jgi:NodT family efflux transporter outer membrane factor (OMF) lipoprotein
MKQFAFKGIPAGLIAVLLCTSCTSLFGPDERTPMDLPAVYRMDGSGTAAPNEWWQAFGDGQLDRLVGRALSGNLSVEQAAARLRQAEATAIEAGADRFPSVNGTADAGTTHQHTDSQGTVTTDDYSLGMAASYELDLWGRVASTRRAALYELDSSRFDLETAAMTIAAETADTYFQWQYLHQRLAVLEGQLAVNRKMLSVIERRFQTSSASALDVLQQRRYVAAVEANIPPVKASLAAAYNALAILTGVPPQTDLKLERDSLPGLSPRPEAGLPSDLLTRRPDLQAEWALLAAADWNVSAARASRMPTLTLTGSAAYQDDSVDDLFDNWARNLAAGLAAPLIDGGRLRAQVAMARAAADEQVAAYREAVITALGEVEDALSAETRQQEHLEALRRQLDATTLAAAEAFRRYTRGLETYYDALGEETSRQTLEVSVLQAKYELLSARVQLYRVLGGDWSDVLERYRTEGGVAEIL